MQNKAKIIKRIAIWSILFIQMTGFFYDNIAQAWSYPLKEVSKPACKADNWDKLSADCKMALPIIAKANYKIYKDNQLSRLIYTVLRGGTYADGWDLDHGAHEGIDIVSSEGTPVYAIGDGEVVKARKAVGYGNLVTIKHIMNNSPIYSIYGHLATITVKEGDKIKEREQIGTVGHEGMARGNHLHFAINTTKDNTYVFQGCENYPKIGDYEIVEKGLCRDNLFSRSVDPIAFIEFNGYLPTATVLTTSRVISKNIIKRNVRTMIPIGPTAVTIPTTTKLNTIPATTPTIKPATSFSSTSVTSSESFLKTWKISVVSNFGASLKKGGTSTIAIVIQDANGKKFSGVLSKDISITPTKSIVTLSPRVIRYVSEGQVISFIEAKEVGTTELVVSYGDVVIGKLVVNVQ